MNNTVAVIGKENQLTGGGRKMRRFKEILATLNETRAFRFYSDPEREEACRLATTLALAELLERLAESEEQQLSARAQAMTQAQ